MSRQAYTHPFIGLITNRIGLINSCIAARQYVPAIDHMEAIGLILEPADREKIKPLLHEVRRAAYQRARLVFGTDQYETGHMRKQSVKSTCKEKVEEVLSNLMDVIWEGEYLTAQKYIAKPLAGDEVSGEVEHEGFKPVLSSEFDKDDEEQG